MSEADSKRLKALEKENPELKKMYAEVQLPAKIKTFVSNAKATFKCIDLIDGEGHSVDLI